ncbi:MAG: hypothetical protein LBU48_05615 [Coriobacteriales bacterium]|jgi:hypothetical protein|nr:hypothetical protein [Coriobacteriales bacterium]
MRIVGLREDITKKSGGVASVAKTAPTAPVVDKPVAPPATPPASTAPVVDKPLDELTLAELRDFADLGGISLGAATKKEDILTVIKKAQGL